MRYSDMTKDICRNRRLRSSGLPAVARLRTLPPASRNATELIYTGSAQFKPNRRMIRGFFHAAQIVIHTGRLDPWL